MTSLKRAAWPCSPGLPSSDMLGIGRVCCLGVTTGTESREQADTGANLDHSRATN